MLAMMMVVMMMVVMMKMVQVALESGRGEHIAIAIFLLLGGGGHALAIKDDVYDVFNHRDNQR